MYYKHNSDKLMSFLRELVRITKYDNEINMTLFLSELSNHYRENTTLYFFNRSSKNNKKESAMEKVRNIYA